MSLLILDSLSVRRLRLGTAVFIAGAFCLVKGTAVTTGSYFNASGLGSAPSSETIEVLKRGLFIHCLGWVGESDGAIRTQPTRNGASLVIVIALGKG